MATTPKFKNPSKSAKAVLKLALSYPEATEAHPWGEVAVKVKNKTFVFMGARETGFGFSVKLPTSWRAALKLPFCKSTGYGLGKSGWVSAEFGTADEVPMQLVRQWIHESYVAIAPKALSKLVPTPK